MLFGAPLAYVALSAYLLAKVQPFPVTFIPRYAGELEPARERLAA
jgi:hypothetical protein